MVRVSRAYVDNDNKFIFKRVTYKIDDSVKEYEVSNSGMDMDEIIIIERTHENRLVFLDANAKSIEGKMVSIA